MWRLVHRGGYVVAIASLARRCDAELADWVHERANWIEATPKGAFADTTFFASWFAFRIGTTMLEELRSSVRDEPWYSEDALRELGVLSKDLHELNTDSCNGDVDEDAFEAAVRTILARARAIVGAEVQVRNACDPRAGYGFRLGLHSGRTNDWGRSGMIVPPARCGGLVTVPRRVPMRGLRAA